MRHESEVLLQCARPAAAGRAALERMAPADGPRLLALAVAHEVVPLLARGLRTAALDAPTAAEVVRRCDAIAARNRAWAAELGRVVGALGEAGVRPLVFKGPALALQAYGDLSLRAFDDLDLLVARADLAATTAALAPLGWLPEVDPAHLAAVARRGGPLPTEITFGSFPGLPDLDVHLSLVPRYLAMRLDEAGAGARAVEVEVAGSRLRTLSPEDLLLYLCANGLKDAWTHLRAVADVAHLLAASPIDGEALAERARRVGLERPLQLGVGLATALLGAPALAGVGGTALVDTIARRWDEQPYDERMLARVGLHLRARERWRDRLAYAAAAPRDVMVRDLEAVRLPPALYPLYYAVRPARLALKYALRRG